MKKIIAFLGPALHQNAKKPIWNLLGKLKHEILLLITVRSSPQGSEKPSDHFLYLWDKIIMRSAARSIAIMAHSYGGCVVLDLVCAVLFALQFSQAKKQLLH